METIKQICDNQGVDFLDICEDVKKISTAKEVKKMVNNTFHKERDLIKMLRREFRPNIPNGLNNDQEMKLQELYLKWKLVGYKIQDLKNIRLIVAENEKKKFRYTRNFIIDYTKLKD
jgi:hypothetical protein